MISTCISFQCSSNIFCDNDEKNIRLTGKQNPLQLSVNFLFSHNLHSWLPSITIIIKREINMLMTLMCMLFTLDSCANNRKSVMLIHQWLPSQLAAKLYKLKFKNKWCTCIHRLQNNPYFCVFKYGRAVKQNVWNEAENIERDWGETLKIRTVRFAYVIFVRITRFSQPRAIPIG